MNLYYIDFGELVGGKYVWADGFFVNHDGSLVLWRDTDDTDRENVFAFHRNRWAIIRIVDEEGIGI